MGGCFSVCPITSRLPKTGDSIKIQKCMAVEPYLGNQLGSDILAHSRYKPYEKSIICPVPLFILRRWRRGFNQAEEIARKLSKTMDIQHLSLLKRTKQTRNKHSSKIIKSGSKMCGVLLKGAV